MTICDQLFDRVFELLDRKPVPAAESDDASSGDAAADSGVPWVLCIDDDPDFTRALKLRLESHGVAVERAFDGAQGVRSAFTTLASAIILDYCLPNGQGDYVLRRLKENPVTRDIPVIMVTGIKNRAIERKLFNLGAETLLPKPLDFSELRKELAHYIDILRGVAPGSEAPSCQLVV